MIYDAGYFSFEDEEVDEIELIRDDLKTIGNDKISRASVVLITEDTASDLGEHSTMVKINGRDAIKLMTGVEYKNIYSFVVVKNYIYATLTYHIEYDDDYVK